MHSSGQGINVFSSAENLTVPIPSPFTNPLAYVTDRLVARRHSLSASYGSRFSILPKLYWPKPSTAGFVYCHSHMTGDRTGVGVTHYRSCRQHVSCSVRWCDRVRRTNGQTDRQTARYIFACVRAYVRACMSRRIATR